MNLTLMAGQLFGALILIFTANNLFLETLSGTRKAILYFYILISGIIIAPNCGQAGTPLFLTGCLVILISGKRRFSIWNMLLFQAVWLWSVITDYAVSVPLRFLHIDFEAIRSSLHLQIIFSCIHALLSIFPGYFAGRWLKKQRDRYPDLVSRGMQWMLFCEVSICSCIFLINIVYGSLTDYPTEILLFNGFLFLGFTVVNFLIFFNLYRTMRENQILALKAQEQEKLAEYTAQLENHYQDMRRFRHDYMNLLSALNGYIQENDMDRLKSFFETRLLPEGKMLVNRDAVIARLSNIKVLEVKGILYTKLVRAMNLNLNITLELTDEITGIDLDPLVLCRVLGIYLDNAIEAASETEEKKLWIALVRNKSRFIFHLENSTLPISIPVDRLTAEGITTKQGHSGMGLSNAAKMLSAYPNTGSAHCIADGRFRQILTVNDTRSTQ